MRDEREEEDLMGKDWLVALGCKLQIGKWEEGSKK